MHVYATDPSAPNMDTSDSVGWFIVDMRDLAGQRQQERWVKLQGASPAEVLISSSLAMARDPQQGSAREAPEHQRRLDSKSADNSSAGERETSALASRTSGAAASEDVNPPIAAVGGAGGVRVASVSSDREIHPSPGVAESEAAFEGSEGGGHAGDYSSNSHSANNSSAVSGSMVTGSMVSGGSMINSRSSMINSSPERAAVRLSTSSIVDAVSELDALPVGPGADSDDAEIFSLAISVKAISASGAAGLSGLAPESKGSSGGGGLWLSYSIFGVVVQTDRFEGLEPPLPGGGSVLDPMLDSFRLRATLQGLCQFFGEAPPLQVGVGIWVSLCSVEVVL